MSEDYNDYDFKDAVKILKDANNRCKNKEYAIAIYSAYIAKEVFEKFKNPFGVEMCNETIDMSRTGIVGKVIDELMQQGETVTPFKISTRMMASKDVAELGELVFKDVKASRLSLDEMGELYKRLIDGDCIDSIEYIHLSDN